MAAIVIACVVALAGCGDHATSMREFCKHYGGGPAMHDAARTQPSGKRGTTVICNDSRLRFISGDVKP